MSIFRAWIQPTIRSSERFFATDVTYENTSILFTLANVKNCTLTFSISATRDHQDLWLIFDMGYDYLMYGSVSVTGDSIDVIDLQNRRQTEVKGFLSEHGHYFRPDLDSGPESWFRVIPIPIRLRSSSSDIKVQVSFSFVFLANVNDSGHLYFPFPLFADVETKVVFKTVKIVELGQRMNVTGLPQCQADVVHGKQQDGFYVLKQDIKPGGDDFRIVGGVMRVTLEITGGIDAPSSLALKARDKILIPSFSSSRSTVDLKTVGHIIFMNVDSFYDLGSFSPRDHVKATAKLLSQCIPSESKQISYYWHKNDGKFDDHDGIPVRDVVSDIAGQLSNQVTSLHIWIIYPVDNFEEFSKWIAPVLKELDVRISDVQRQVYHVWVATTAYPKSFPELGMKEKSCCLPRAFSLTRAFANTIGLACFGLEQTHKDPVFDEFPFVCPFWRERTRICISPVEESDIEQMSLVCCDSLLSKSEMSDLIFMADLICVANKIIAEENELSTVCLQNDEEAEGKADAMMERLRDLRDAKENGVPRLFSRLWALSVERKGSTMVVEPAVDGRVPKLDKLVWMQYASWPEKGIMTKKATEVFLMLEQAKRFSNPSEWAINYLVNRMPDLFPRGSFVDDCGESWDESMKHVPLEKLRQWIFQRKLRVPWMHWYDEATSGETLDE